MAIQGKKFKWPPSSLLRNPQVLPAGSVSLKRLHICRVHDKWINIRVLFKVVSLLTDSHQYATDSTPRVSDHWRIIVVPVQILRRSSSIFLCWILTTKGKKRVRKRDNTKALWKLPDHHQRLPRLLGNQTLLFNCWMFQGIQLVQLFPYRRYSERPQCIVGYNTPETWSKRWFVLLFVHQSQQMTQLYSVTVAMQCSRVGVCVRVQPNSHAWPNRMDVFMIVFLFF